MAEEIEPRFPPNMLMLITGATSSGKTQFVKDILACYDCWERYPDKITISYAANPEQYHDIDNAELVQGLPDLQQFVSTTDHHQLILDDATQLFLDKNQDLLNLFCIHSHHGNKSVIAIVHNPYISPFIRNIRLNSGYIVFF